MNDWIYDRLGLLVLKEDAGGALVPNAIALATLGSGPCPNVGTALDRVLHGRVSRARIETLLERARLGVSGELVAPGGERIVVLQELPGRAMAVLTPPVPTAAVARPANPIDTASHELRAGVSHELANALGAIAGWARLAKQGRRVREALELIEMSADSAWIAAQRLLSDAPVKRDLAQGSVDLSAFVDEAARLIGPKANAGNVLVRTAIEPGVFVLGDRGSAWSIVWNLAANAIEALPAGGTLEMRLRVVDGVAMLVIEDDGPGMSDEQQRRAFEPYFTTKATGTGLGLVMVKQAVTAVGGSLELHSDPGHGTRFSVALPLAAPRAAGTRRSSGVFYAEPILHRILIVDDDLGLRELMSTALSMRGADVVAVANAREALTQPGPFAAVIVDLLLPDERGDVLLAKLRDSGLTEIGMLVTGMELPADLSARGVPDVVLRKPFELEELFEALTTALGLVGSDRESAAG